MAGPGSTVALAATALAGRQLWLFGQTVVQLSPWPPLARALGPSYLETALAADVPVGRVSILSPLEGTVRRVAPSSLQITAQISTDNFAAATALSKKMDVSTVNQNLQRVSLPQISSVMANVKSSTTLTAASGSLSTSVIAAASVSSFVFVLLCIGSGYYLFVLFQRQRDQRAFVIAFYKAKTGDQAFAHTLPLNLRKQYTAEKVIGKGAFGCVVQALKKGQNQKVAIKIAVPER